MTCLFFYILVERGDSVQNTLEDSELSDSESSLSIPQGLEALDSEGQGEKFLII